MGTNFYFVGANEYFVAKISNLRVQISTCGNKLVFCGYKLVLCGYKKNTNLLHEYPITFRYSRLILGNTFSLNIFLTYEYLNIV